MANLKPGSWIELGRYGGEKGHPILWRSVGPKGDAVAMISAYVLTNQPFDDPRRGYENGDNRWSQCTLRSRLNNVEQGFLRLFPKDHLAALSTVSIKTEVCSTYDETRDPSVDTTEDRVWLPTWEEYKKLPESLRGGKPAKSFLAQNPDFALDKQPHWSRSPNDGFGCFVLELFFKSRAECNSGGACEWGIRPWIGLRKDVELRGDGTEKKPLRLA